MSVYEIEARVLEEQHTAVVSGELGLAEIGPFLGSAFATVAAYVARQEDRISGMPFARYRRLEGNRFAVEAGFPTRGPVPAEGAVRPSRLPGGAAAVTWHVGPYETMAPAYGALADWIAARGAVPDGDPWEVYWSDPATEPDPATWRTEVVQPYRPS